VRIPDKTLEAAQWKMEFRVAHMPRVFEVGFKGLEVVTQSWRFRKGVRPSSELTGRGKRK